MEVVTTTLTDLRTNTKKYFDAVVEENKTIIIPRNKKGVVIISLDEYNSIMETEHLLSSKKNAERLINSLRQAEKGNLLNKKPSSTS